MLKKSRPAVVCLDKTTTFAPEIKNTNRNRTMKTVKIALSVLALAFLASCKKNEVAQADNNSGNGATPARNISVEYRITFMSPSITVNYKDYQSGTSVVTTEDITHSVYTHPFTTTSGQELFISAQNTMMSGDQIIVEVFVDGTLWKTATADFGHPTATVQAIYY